MKSLLLLSASLLFISCKGGIEDNKSGNTGSGSESERAASTRKNLSGSVIIIETSMGTIEAKLHTDTAPVTTTNFLSYVDKEHFDNTIFHRVMEGFMIQGGGFELKNEVATEKATGEGITNESAQTRANSRGTLAMARTNQPHSATAQFFINVVDNKSLDHPASGQGFGYAVFGEVTKGMDVVDQIRAVPTAETYMNSLTPGGRIQAGPHGNVPIEPVVIKSIRRAPKS